MTGKERGNDEGGVGMMNGRVGMTSHSTLLLRKAGLFLALFPFKSTKPTFKVGFGLIEGKGSSF